MLNTLIHFSPSFILPNTQTKMPEKLNLLSIIHNAVNPNKETKMQKNVAKECDLLTYQGPRGMEGGLVRDNTFSTDFSAPFHNTRKPKQTVDVRVLTLKENSMEYIS